ncbi:MAG: GUN4 domain-containing protein [Oscillatoriophycideae cyanobacterium NC_groundwater_1537_Pr4_S-0.65um_50_18]|nr:GUN4 domain-containing protein [Oscillatoriophycideae cyanobacterium NC_groundwater_1537_Pr4_S-0.65um_50_18]
MITPENARSYAIFVKQYARNGQISVVNRSILQRQQAQLKLTPAEAEAIERRVLQLLTQAAQAGTPSLRSASASAAPLVEATATEATDAARGENISRPTHVQENDSLADPKQQSIRQYGQEFLRAIQLESPPGELLRQELKQSQARLALTDETVNAIEYRVSQNFHTQSQQYQTHLKRYEQAFSQALQQGLPLSPATQEHLSELQQSLGLRQPDVTDLQGQLLSQHLTATQADESAQTALDEIDLDQTALVDTPSTQILPAYASTVPTAPPAESASFISTQDIPPELPPTQLPAQPIAAAQSTESEPLTLRSEAGVDYVPLRDLLRQQKWLEADRETLAVMLKAANRTEAGWLDAEALTQFPCSDLHTIDRLWSYYSNGKFGFRAQWHVYPMPKRSRTSFAHTQPSRVVQNQVLEFTKKIDWWTERLEFLKYHNQLTFSLEAPQGHLPALWFWTIPWWKALQNGGIGSGRGGCSVDNQTLPAFMARLRVCGFE